MTITINNQNFELTNEQVNKLKKALGLNGKQLADVAIGDTFKIADIEFIKFAEENGEVIAVAKDSLFNAMFGDNNNLKTSNVLKGLKKEILPKIEAAVGAENVLEFETDLFSMDGSHKYGVMKSKISLPTVDFYRNNRRIFEKHKLNKWWWLATPDSTDEFGNSSSLVRCVGNDGALRINYCSNGYGVRPFLIFKSNIFVSC